MYYLFIIYAIYNGFKFRGVILQIMHTNGFGVNKESNNAWFDNQEGNQTRCKKTFRVSFFAFSVLDSESSKTDLEPSLAFRETSLVMHGSAQCLHNSSG